MAIKTDGVIEVPIPPEPPYLILDATTGTMSSSSEQNGRSEEATEPTPTHAVAIIGAGPAGFYAADALLKDDELCVRVDIYNRFPPPFGLVRDGVAPDHQPIKSVTRIYEKILSHPRVRYFGNVDIGTDISVDELKQWYDGIVYAVGAQTDRRLGIPGEDLDGSRAATEFVGWYNGRPDFADLSFDLSAEEVVVVGNGNVAMDVARILLLPFEALAETDIADHALAVLKHSNVKRVTLLGRRGPAQAAFTNPELREFGKIEDVWVDVDGDDLALDTDSQAAIAEDRTKTRNMATLEGYADDQPSEGDRCVRFMFLTSPAEIVGSEGRVAGVRVERNELVKQDDGSLRPRGTGEMEEIPAGLVLRSVGYRGSPIPGVPFDDRRGVLPNEEGRLVNEGKALPGEYVVGWAKRGPSGVIGTNKSDAAATAVHVLEDLKNGRGLTPSAEPSAPVAVLEERGVRWVDIDGWRRLDAHEVAAGESAGRPRVKVCDVERMLEIIEQS